MRIDKWLWCVRIFKTRTLATSACDCGKVKKGGLNIKPSKDITVGDIIEIYNSPIIKTIKVKALLGNRVGAKDVPIYLEDLTPQELYDNLKIDKTAIFEKRDSHIGRPTKKDRRSIQKFKEQ